MSFNEIANSKGEGLAKETSSPFEMLRQSKEFFNKL